LDREFVKMVAGSICEAIEIVECDCGQAAVDICLSINPRVMVLDRGAGAVDGFETARRVSNGNRNTAILMTGWDEGDTGENDIASLLSMNIVGYLLKPIHSMKMKDALSKHLEYANDFRDRHVLDKRSAPVPARSGMSREIAKAMSHIDGNFRKDMSLESVAAYISVSAGYFSRLFKKEVGVNFLQYLTKRRLEYAKHMITQTDRSMLEIAVEAGFNEQNYFGKVFKRYTGQTPLEYKRGVCPGRNGIGITGNDNFVRKRVKI
jgi:YesN/AraC family two-component response regulator